MMTGVMLFLFEALVVKQRMNNLSSLRNMIRKSYSVKVFRNGNWQTIQSHDLFPGDILALEPDPTKLIPCDALIIAGGGVVNEAMLTGESKPQRKDAILNLSPNDQPLNFRYVGSFAFSHHKKNSYQSSLLFL